MINLTTLAAEIFPKPSPTALPQVQATDSLLQTILQIVFGMAGTIAVLVITIAGLQYVISQGDPQKTAKAKDTILYAVIGLAVAVTGYGLVTFVIGRIIG